MAHEIYILLAIYLTTGLLCLSLRASQILAAYMSEEYSCST
jgi:hypothetical protein